MNEYPKEKGWHWFKISPNTGPIPAYVYKDRDWLVYSTVLGNDGMLVTSTWPQQWGGKIDEPK